MKIDAKVEQKLRTHFSNSTDLKKVHHFDLEISVSKEHNEKSHAVNEHHETEKITMALYSNQLATEDPYNPYGKVYTVIGQ